MVGAGAGAHDVEVGAFKVVFDGDMGGGDVADHFGDEEGTDAARALSVAFDAFFFEGDDAADAHTGDHTHAVRIKGKILETGVTNGFPCGEERELGIDIQFAGFFGVEVFFRLEVFDFSGDVGGKG